MPRARWSVRPRSAGSRCRKGELAEIEFLRRAERLGLTVTKPFGHGTAYDFIVDAGGRLSRVQVKSTWGRGKWMPYAVRVGHFDARRGATPYRKSEIDYIAAYVEPEEAWYIIPIRAIPGANTIALFPHVPGSQGRYEKYREAWSLLIG